MGNRQVNGSLACNPWESNSPYVKKTCQDRLFLSEKKMGEKRAGQTIFSLGYQDYPIVKVGYKFTISYQYL